MLRLTLTLIPKGDERKAHELGRIEIVNIGTSEGGALGDYVACMDGEAGQHGCTLRDHPRMLNAKHDPWVLVFSVLREILFNPKDRAH